MGVLLSDPDGFSEFVVALNEAEAVAQALVKFQSRRGVPAFEVPLYVEDLGDATWEVVLRARVTTVPAVRPDQDPDLPPDIIRLENFLGTAGLRGRA